MRCTTQGVKVCQIEDLKEAKRDWASLHLRCTNQIVWRLCSRAAKTNQMVWRPCICTVGSSHSAKLQTSWCYIFDVTKVVIAASPHHFIRCLASLHLLCISSALPSVHNLHTIWFVHLYTEGVQGAKKLSPFIYDNDVQSSLSFHSSVTSKM